MVNVAIANNRAYQQGGGLWSGEESLLSLTRLTFWGNQAVSQDGSVSLGGALLLAGNAPVTIQQTTLANNRAGFQGGGFWGGSGTTQLVQVLAADKAGSANSNGFNLHHHTGTTFSGRNNVQSPGANPNDTKLTANTQLLEPQLAAWQDTGRAAPVHPCYRNAAIAPVGAGSGPRCPR